MRLSLHAVVLHRSAAALATGVRATAAANHDQLARSNGQDCSRLRVVHVVAVRSDDSACARVRRTVPIPHNIIVN